MRQGPTKTIRRMVGTTPLDFDFGAYQGDLLTVSFSGAANIAITTNGDTPGNPGSMDTVEEGLQAPGDFTNWFQVELDHLTSIVKVRSTDTSTNVAIGLARQAPDKV